MSQELVQEMSDLRAIYVANFGEEQLHSIDLLNNLQKTKLQTLFLNCCIVLRTSPGTVTEGERSFSKLKLVKNYLPSTINQDRLTDLGTLATESSFVRKVNIIDYTLHNKRLERHTYNVYVPRNLRICAISRLQALKLRDLEIAQYTCAISRLRNYSAQSFTQDWFREELLKNGNFVSVL